MKKITGILFIALACCLFACSEREREREPECVFETVGMPISSVDAFNSVTTPEVILKITGRHHNGCVSVEESRAYYKVDGNTITVWGTMYAGFEVCYCTLAIKEIVIMIDIGVLEPGEYKVVSQSGEQLLTFHTDNLGEHDL